MKQLIIGALTVLVLPILVLGVEAVIAVSGMREDFRNPDPSPRTFAGTGAPLKYVVLGDSTAAGQGADYENGIAVGTASHLAEMRAVELSNFGISGAKTADVLENQVREAATRKPDITLIAVGANDVTNLSSGGSVQGDLQQIIDTLLDAKCDMKIVLTGSPDFRGAHRLMQPLRWVAGKRADRINQSIQQVIDERGLTRAPIAPETGPLFQEDPTLLAADRFHPNERGYATWIPVLNKAIDEALRNQPDHCESVS